MTKQEEILEQLKKYNSEGFPNSVTNTQLCIFREKVALKIVDLVEHGQIPMGQLSNQLLTPSLSPISKE